MSDSESIWNKTTRIEEYPSLPGDMSVEVAVIGGGLAGILTAYYLRRRGIEAVVLEARRIGSGQTGNTTAKITSQHNLVYHKLIKSFGEVKARQYADANEKAVTEYRRVISEGGIDCDFADFPAYLYSTSEKDVEALTQETSAARRLGIDAMFTEQTALPFRVAGAVRFGGQAQFHPLKFLQAIARGLTIFEETKVSAVEGVQVLTDRGTVKAKHVVFATHFPFVNFPGFYFARMHQKRSYVLALEHAAQLGGMYRGVDVEGLSFRNYRDALLLGGGGHRTGENSKGGKYDFLRGKAAALYPGSVEIAHWSAQDCMPMDGVPYIGQFASSTPNWYVATGFKKWGMTTSMVSAMLLSDLIAGIENPYAEVFSPGRFTPSASAKAFLVDGSQAMKGLSRQILGFRKSAANDLPYGHGGVVRHDGEKIGVYKDEMGEISVVSTRCPHLGCQLEWNPDEKTWDCPCHGSRFDKEGHVLDNPAQEDLVRPELAEEEPASGEGQPGSRKPN